MAPMKTFDKSDNQQSETPIVTLLREIRRWQKSFPAPQLQGGVGCSGEARRSRSFNLHNFRPHGSSSDWGDEGAFWGCILNGEVLSQKAAKSGFIFAEG